MITEIDLMAIATKLNNAIDRAREKKQTTFIRIYPSGKDVHIGEFVGDAALEIQEYIKNGKNAQAIHKALTMKKPIVDTDLTVEEVKELIVALEGYLECKSSSH